MVRFIFFSLERRERAARELEKSYVKLFPSRDATGGTGDAWALQLRYENAPQTACSNGKTRE
jgi:hypothetical protein